MVLLMSMAIGKGVQGSYHNTEIQKTYCWLTANLTVVTCSLTSF